jgi:FkbM family methyltransferase
MNKNFFCKITRRIIKIFGLNPLFFNAPYDYVQAITEQHVHSYLNLDNSMIKSWCIVGGHHGNEANKIIKSYPNARLIIFECSHRYINKLKKNFKDNEKVEIIEKAVSASNGTSKFFETSLNGGGSLLKVGQLAKQSYQARNKESFEVETISLDSFFKNKELDVLQIDVQGAEKLVIQGAVNVLKNTKAVFVEISVKPNLYKGSVTFEEISRLLAKSGFKLALLGTDFNLTGNALFLKVK